MARKSASRRTARRSKRNHSHPSKSLVGRSLYHRRLRLEPLEDRRLLAVVTVTTLSDTVDFSDGLTSLREAIFATNLVPGADTIRFDPALTAGGPAKILLTGGELAITDSLTIDGPGADALTIDAQLQSRIFDITSTTGDYTLDELTLTGGKTVGSNFGGDTTYSGGAIRSISAGKLELDDCVVSSSQTTGSNAHGGGIFSTGLVVLNGTTISGNSTLGFSREYGGGVFAAGDISLMKSTISQNTSRKGGGISAGGATTIVESTINNNSTSAFGSTYGGGGVFSVRNVTLTDSTVSGNNSGSSFRGGGGVYSKGDVTLLRSTVSDNTAYSGGGIRAVGSVTLDQSTISGNRASRSGGGGIDAGSVLGDPLAPIVTVIVDGSTVSGNTSGGAGGGIRCGGEVTLAESVVSGNTAKTLGGGVYCATATISHSTVNGNHLAGGQDPRFGSGGAGVFSNGDVTLDQSDISENTIASGGLPYGAGIRSNGSVTIDHCTITSNSAGTGSGGGVFAKAAVMVDASTIGGNSAYDGGGIFSRVVILNDSVLSNNNGAGSFASGGAIFAFDVTVNRSNVTGNRVDTGAFGGGSGGGGISASTITLTESMITGNISSGVNANGGGIASNSVTIADSTIANNQTDGGGGGIIARSSLNVRNSTISGNSAKLLGGGIWTENGSATIAYSTVYNNHGGAIGGGVFVRAGTLSLDHTIVAGNTSLIGKDVSGSVGAVIDARYSLIGTNDSSGLAPAPIGSPDANGNLIGGAYVWIGPKLGPLVYNGGPVFLDGSRLLTHALLPGSPAIDAGDPSAVAGVGGVPVSDQRGAPFTRVFGGRIDMGAVESQPNPLPGDYNFNGIVDAADYTRWRDSLGSNVAAGSGADGNGDGVVNQLDYDVWKANFGATLPMGGGAESAKSLAEPVAPGAQSQAEPVAPNDKVQGLLSNRTAGQASSGTQAEPLIVAAVQSKPPTDPEVGYPARAVGVLALQAHFDAAARQDRLLALWAATRDEAARPHVDRWAENGYTAADGSKSLAEPVAPKSDVGNVDADALDCALAGVGDLRLMIDD